jgi:hypothetical protein
MHIRHFRLGHAFTRAHKAAARASRRGDLVAAVRWLKIAERHQRLALRLFTLAAAEDEMLTARAWSIAGRKRLRREGGGDDIGDAGAA